VIQVDAAALLGSGKMSKQARALLEAGLVDCIASDNHGDSRSLASARRWLMEVGTEEQADLLTRVNAERLLAGLSMLPVPPLPRIDSGMLSRLRDLILGR
jgi:protein-tyrosine phosphatase